MAVVLCTDLEPVRTQAYGNWFEFKPGQVKPMQDHIADFLCSNRKSQGFIALPESFLDDPKTADNQRALAAAYAEGRKAIVTELRKLRHNFEVSTQKDIDISGEKRSFMTELQPCHKEVYRRLALFKNAESDQAARDEEEIKRYMEQIDGSNAKPADAREAVKRG